MTDLNVPSNGRFSQEDLHLLWDAGAELARWQARMAMARRTGTFGSPEVAGTTDRLRDWRSLELCAHDAAVLIGRWPTRVDRRSTWLPIGVPGGVEDVPLTAQEATERGYVVEQDDVLAITQSARWVGDRRPLRSVSVAAMAWAVIQVVRQTVPSDQMLLIKSLVNPIATVAQLAATPAGHRDPDASSWPIPFVNFVASCMRVIADLQSSERGRGVVPLLDTDELYEAWLAIEARDALDAHLGGQIMAGSDALAAWERDDIVYELWVKPSIPRAGRTFGNATFLALVAELLTPDLILSASRDDETAVHVLDAKSWAQMLPEQALEQSAKYLYGIRRESDVLQVSAIAGVDLVTCAPPPTAPRTAASRVRVLGATPTRGSAALHLRVSEVADLLATEIEARERLASGY
ncbi:MAG: hypothetical protein ACSLEW_03710 [Nocardioides sp.]